MSKLHRIIGDLEINIAAEYLQSNPEFSYPILDVDPSAHEGQLKSAILDMDETIRVRFFVNQTKVSSAEMRLKAPLGESSRDMPTLATVLLRQVQVKFTKKFQLVATPIPNSCETYIPKPKSVDFSKLASLSNQLSLLTLMGKDWSMKLQRK